MRGLAYGLIAITFPVIVIFFVVFRCSHPRHLGHRLAVGLHASACPSVFTVFVVCRCSRRHFAGMIAAGAVPAKFLMY